MNKQKEEIMKTLINTWVGDEAQPRISLDAAADKLVAVQDKAEGRGYKKGAFQTGGFTLVAIFLVGLVRALVSHEARTSPLPDRPEILIDTSLEEHSEIPDSVRQASPELQRAYDSSVKAFDPKIAVVQECHLTTFGYWSLETVGWNHGAIVYYKWINGPTEYSCERHRKEEYDKGYAVVYGAGTAERREGK